MKITKKEDHYLLKNSVGEYHLSIDEFDKLGEQDSIKLAQNEIKKKLDSGQYPHLTINFSQARDLGFCEYGIKEFCTALSLNTEENYSIKDLNKGLTLDVLNDYTEECLKLFGADTLKYLGGIKEVLSEDNINLVLREEFIPEKTLHLLSVEFAKTSLHFFEDQYPDDKRPREAIEAKEAYIRGDITKEQLHAAHSAAYSAADSAAHSAYSAADSAAHSAYSAADSAAHSAAHSAARSAYSAADSAAHSAYSAAHSAYSAAHSAAHSAARKEQVKIILRMLGDTL